MEDNEYKIKYESIEEFSRMASGNIARWEEELSEIEGCLKRLLNMETFQGESADAIRTYIQEVHITLLSAIRQCLREYSTRLLMYQSEYYKIDSDKGACLPEKEISDIGKHLQKQEEFLLERDESIRSILDEISDILPLPVPSQEKLLSDIGEVTKKSNKLNVDVRSYESEKAKEVMEEFTPLTESIKKAIQKYTGQERQLSGYASGDADKVQEIAELNKKVMQSNWYMIDNGADIQAALKEKGEQVEENQPVWYSQKYNAEKPDMHLILDLAGMLPIAGAVFDGINATWYLAEGDYTNAALSGMALIPVVGEFAGAGKAGLKGLKCADDIADAVKALDNTKDVAKAVDDMSGTAKYLDGVIENGSKTIGIDELVVRDTKFLDVDGNIDWEKWAPNGGRVAGTIKENQTIPAGTIIDRYGSKWGKYTSPAGVPYEQRALPYIENPNAYHKYEVLKPIDNVTISKIAPAFEQVGGGMQYELPINIKKLKELGYIKEIK